MADLCSQLTEAINAVAAALDSAPMKQVMDDLAKAAVDDDVDAAVRADLGGDTRFSGWDAQLTAGSSVTGPTAREIKPVSKGIGPFTVAQRGRNVGDARGFQGPGVNKKTGVTSRKKDGSLRKIGAVKGRRWNGRTAPKHTWDDAEELIKKNTPERARKVVVAALTKQFKI